MDVSRWSILVSVKIINLDVTFANYQFDKRSWNFQIAHLKLWKELWKE